MQVLVKFHHLRELNYCASGIRAFGRRYEIDIRRFQTGVPSSEIRATGNPFAIKAAELAEGESR